MTLPNPNPVSYMETLTLNETVKLPINFDLFVVDWIVSSTPPQEVHMLKFQTLEPQNLTVARDRVFAELPKFKSGHYGGL